jgi:DNA-directed RNA polymerase subunit RPC12/RpoP
MKKSICSECKKHVKLDITTDAQGIRCECPFCHKIVDFMFKET